MVSTTVMIQRLEGLLGTKDLNDWETSFVRTLAARMHAGELRIAHNESFDMRMVRIEMMRLMAHDAPIHDEWKTSPAFCTQSKSTKIINLPPTEKMLAAGRRTPKSPNLGEAFRHFTGTDLVGAHNAAVDLAACRTVYYGIKRHLATAA